MSGGRSSDASRLARVEALFHECVALPAAQREALLDARCGADASLRAEVLDLLARDARHDTGALSPIVPRLTGEGAEIGAAPGPHPALPLSIGPYRLVEKLGEGGFGEVFAAEQTEPVRRRVAVKILKAGMDSRAVLSRFEAERHALALMDHPGVARVLDAGAANDGRPYFVMELVGGESITAFCDRSGVSLRDRLTLFVAVCRAVEHAHQKGVIHRDLKPSNILVAIADGTPVPKVIDFGIAKAAAGALAGETLHTSAEDFLGTPEFMSPEHAETGGADVDTRTDVYSLGAILYRLLTGRLPFESKKLRGAGVMQIQKTLREEEPARPSVAVREGEGRPTVSARELSGDLDWIVGRAMEKDRTRRYSSAAALADDVERYLRDEPVLAGPPSTIYRVGKFVRRRRALVAGAAAVLAALVIGIVSTTTQAVRARRAEREARRAEQEAKSQAQIAKSVNAFLTDMLAEANPESNPRGTETTVREAVDRAAQLLEGDAVQSPRARAALHHTLGTTYMGLALFDRAEPHLRRAIDTRRVATGDRSDETIESLIAFAELDWRKRNYAAVESASAAIAALVESRPSPAAAELILRCQRLRATALTQLGRHAEADSLFGQVIATQRATRAPGREIAVSLTERAHLMETLGRFDEAEALAREALGIQRQLHQGDHADVSAALGVLASIVGLKGRLVDEEHLEREALDINRRVLGLQHVSTAVALGNLGETLQKQGRHSEAEPLQRESLALVRSLLGEDNDEAAKAKDNLALTLQEQGRYEESLALRRDVVETMRRLFGRMHIASARALNNLGSLYRLMGRHAEAQAAFEEARAVFRELLGDGHAIVVTTTNNLAKALLDQGRAREAESTFTAALANADRVFPEGHPNRAVFHANRARALAALGRRKEAERELLGAHAALTRALSAQHPRTREVAQDLARLYKRWGRHDDAARWRRTAEDSERPAE